MTYWLGGWSQRIFLDEFPWLPGLVDSPGIRELLEEAVEERKDLNVVILLPAFLDFYRPSSQVPTTPSVCFTHPGEDEPQEEGYYIQCRGFRIEPAQRQKCHRPEVELDPSVTSTGREGEEEVSAPWKPPGKLNCSSFP